MNWDDTGYLLSKNKYNENSIIAEIFTENHGKCSGIIFGATSKKIKNYLQIGNKVHINQNIKTEGRIGYFKVEILKALTPMFFDNKEKLLCISSAINLVKILTVESQENQEIFNLIGKLFLILSKDTWIKDYIFWELELLKLVGFNLELKKMVQFEIVNDQKVYFVKSNNEKKNVPNFLVENNQDKLTQSELNKGFKLVSDYLEKNILKPNNINFPSSRLDFINILK